MVTLETFKAIEGEALSAFLSWRIMEDTEMGTQIKFWVNENDARELAGEMPKGKPERHSFEVDFREHDIGKAINDFRRIIGGDVVFEVL